MTGIVGVMKVEGVGRVWVCDRRKYEGILPAGGIRWSGGSGCVGWEDGMEGEMWIEDFEGLWEVVIEEVLEVLGG